ncbi:MAG: hypothetical protein AWM53_00679 [Candidatus Dichloromethanomonas elyunquensis]|nr:MAG: hypothetical protein AWM53_00679 [Candidatus Dichloromethanomonas elyunquensis]
MKFRHNKIKREHSIIRGALDWLEDLSKKREVTDIIPGVIDITNSKERGIAYQYETSTGCKLFMKNGGAIQEVFVVTEKPEAVQEWARKMMEELSLMEAALESESPGYAKDSERKLKKKEKTKPVKNPDPLRTVEQQPEKLLSKRDKLLTGIKEEYQLVEINRGLRDSYVDSLASMADLENPTLEEALEPSVRDALENLQENLDTQIKKRK